MSEGETGGSRFSGLKKCRAIAVNWAPLVVVLGITGLGAVMALGYGGQYFYELEADTIETGANGLPVTFDAVREIGVGLLTGGLIGAALLLIEERRESARDKHDSELSTMQRRHALAIALTVEKDLRNIVLAGQDLQAIVLSGRDLNGADLSNADLTNATLRSADLTDTDLTNADLTNADLTMAKLSEAHLTGATLTNADLTRANLAEAEVSSANFTGANLTRAVLDDVVWSPNSPAEWPPGVAPKNAYRSRVNRHQQSAPIARSTQSSSEGRQSQYQQINQTDQQQQ